MGSSRSLAVGIALAAALALLAAPAALSAPRSSADAPTVQSAPAEAPATGRAAEAPSSRAATANRHSVESPAANRPAAEGTASPAAAAAKRRRPRRNRVRIVSKGQHRILKKGLVRVKVIRRKRGRVKVRGKSRTFDHPRSRRLTRSKRVRFRRPGRKVVKLRLTRRGRRQVRSCEARTLRVIAKRRGKNVRLRRTNACRPREIDLSRADDCDFIGQQEGSLCLLPFPDDYNTIADEGTETGRRVAFTDAGMPRNEAGTAIAAADYNRNDGFSPGQTIVVRVPGLDNPEALARTDPVPLNRLGRFTKGDTPIVVIDAETGERWPIWVEIDSVASTPESTALLVHPARNFASGHRYIVAMRDLRRANGETIPAPEGFRYYRDRLPSDEDPINAQRGRFESIFRTLRDAGIERRSLYLAWDFTVSSDLSIAERMLHIRDDAFAGLGDSDLADLTVQGAAPSFTVDTVTPTPGDPDIAREIEGTFEVPCYLTPNCAPGGHFALGANGLPSRNGTWTANFICAIPNVVVDTATPGRPIVYGHGLLGSANEVLSGAQDELAQAHGFVNCATDEIGFSNADVPNIVNSILPDLSNFRELTDRVQQGLLNELFLGRLMIHPQGFLSNPAFHVDPGDVGSAPTIDTQRLYYNGNSQGGILGGALTAVAPDHTRAALGVPAMNYSVLLDRSVDFDPFRVFLDESYPGELTQRLALSMIQMLWDRSDPNGYAHRMTDNPLPNTPEHEVLLNVAFGDHQVTTWQADVEARTIGAQAHAPVVFPGRWPGVDVLWDIPRIGGYPFSDSAIVYWDSGPIRPDPANPGEVLGTDPPPIENLPNRTGADPHGDPRRAAAEQQMVSDFLRPNPQSAITDTCSGPCFAGGFTGP